MHRETEPKGTLPALVIALAITVFCCLPFLLMGCIEEKRVEDQPYVTVITAFNRYPKVKIIIVLDHGCTFISEDGVKVTTSVPYEIIRPFQLE